MYMKFKPSMAPVKAAILPLINKDGLPEIAQKLYYSMRTKFVTEYDTAVNIAARIRQSPATVASWRPFLSRWIRMAGAYTPRLPDDPEQDSLISSGLTCIQR